MTLWQFILELLADESCQDIVAWTENPLEFKVCRRFSTPRNKMSSLKGERTADLVINPRQISPDDNRKFYRRLGVAL